MTVKTIYVGFNLPFWVNVAEQLAIESDWQPTYWVGIADIESDVRRNFPSVTFHPLIKAVRGIFPPENVSFSPSIVDRPFLRKFSSIQVDALKMMDRMSALGSFDYHGRERLFYRQLMYWRTVVECENPDLVVFATIPHLIYDYLIYALCQHAGIRTVMFESTPMRGLVFMMESFDGESQAMVLYHQMLQAGITADITLNPETKAYLQTLRGSYDRVPEYMRRAYNEELPGRRRTLTLASAIRKMFDFQNYRGYLEKQLRIIRSRLSPPANYLVQNGKKPEHSTISRREYFLFRRRARRYIRNLEARYACLAKPVDLKKPYIYVALSFQPERTSSPMAGVFVNQLLMVDLLSKSLPDEWLVYVKEHPTQFTPSMNFRAQSGRTMDYYDDFAALPNVRLAPMPVASFDLTDHAQAVATVTGSVGWEAINRGKPVLLFGHPWYRGCEGTFQIDSQQDCIDALEQIEDGYQIDFQKLHLFVSAIEQVGIEGYVEPHLKIADIPDQENAALIARSLQEFWQSIPLDAE